MFCTNCGAPLEGTVNNCPNCGTAVSKDEPVRVNPVPQQAPVYTAPAQQVVTNIVPEENRPLSPWAYFGLQLLFAIPVVGFVFLIIFSCNSGNINRRNFARSYWCSLIILAVVLLVVLLIVMSAGNAAYRF